MFYSKKRLVVFIVCVSIIIFSPLSEVFASLTFGDLRNDIEAYRDLLTNAKETLESETLFVSDIIDGQKATFATDHILVKIRGEKNFHKIPVVNISDINATLKEYRANPDVLYAEPDYEAKALYVPNDTYYSPYQWNFDNSTNGGIHMENAWDIATGTGATVAVVDTGVAYENYRTFAKAPDLNASSFVPGFDFINNDNHPNDDEGHGTHVAGTIAGSTGNNSGVAGIAFGARVMPVKVLDRNGSGPYSAVANGIRFAADNGAKVINLSLGGPSPSATLEDALAYAYSKGVTIVAAAGNDSTNVLSYPAAYNNYVIAVGATRFDRTKSSYSNYGPGIDIVAPGGDTSVDQNGDGYGDGILQQTFGSTPTNFGYYFYQGTSMATPHVAGVATLILSKNPNSSPSDVRAIIEGSADDLGASGYDQTYGYGLLDAAQALLLASGPIDYPPIVAITAPQNNATVSGVIQFSANATDDVSVDHVDFYIGNALISSASLSPYETTWNSTAVSDGAHVLKASAVDSAGQKTETSVSVNVDNIIETTVFNDSFEVSEWNGLWTEDSQNKWSRTTQRKVDGLYSAQVKGSANDARLTSTGVALGGRTNVKITFSWFISSNLISGEYVAFDVSTDGGATWVEKAKLRGNVDQENAWKSVTLDLSCINNLQLRFRGKMAKVVRVANVDAVKVAAW